MRAASAIVREQGPAALSHRSVAARAGAPLSATTYYFTGLDDLLCAAGEAIMTGYAVHAERVVGRALAEANDREAVVEAVLDTVLPRGNDRRVAAHYQYLTAAADAPALTEAFAEGRGRIDQALCELLAAAGSSCPARLAVAAVDGAAVTAISEGRPVRALAREILRLVL